MRVELNENQLWLILNCLEKQSVHFSNDEYEDYKGILNSIETANDSITYDF